MPNKSLSDAGFGVTSSADSTVRPTGVVEVIAAFCWFVRGSFEGVD